METLCIIPARGGSKGIPRKNVRLLAGKPLLAHAIEKAQASRYISRVVISTDDGEIADVARRWGADVVMRPAELATDTASSESALLHTLDYLAESEGYQPDVLVFIQCTAPLMSVEDVDGTVAALLEKSADSALAVAPFYHFVWREDEQGEAQAINHDKRVRPMRQQRDPQFWEPGAVYALRVDGFRQARFRFFGKTVLYVMPTENASEIDEPLDFEMAEMVLRARQAATAEK